MSESDHYVVLGISDSATTIEVKRAYRTLMRRYHPDYNPDPAAAALILEITEAHRVLSHQALRAEYDSQRGAVSPVHLVSANGMEVRLGAVLGVGERARVHRVLDRPGMAVKLYGGGATQAERINLIKLLAIDPKRTTRLRDSGEVVSTLAWPEEAVFGGGMVRGYLMAEHPAGAVPLTVLAQKTGVPPWVDRLDLFVRLHIGMNLALRLDQLHADSITVGDFEPTDVYVAPSLVVTLSGCDTFVVAGGRTQVARRYTSGYAAPEVVEGADFSLESDRFTLAVLLHELITGRHPFRHGTTSRDVSGAELTPLRNAIDRALRSGVRSPEVRPSPREWIAVFQKCAKALRSQVPRSTQGGSNGAT